MSSFKDFLRWYNKEDVVATLEAMQKVIAFYHDKDIDITKLGCTLPNLANICFHKSTVAKFYPFTEGDTDLLEKNSRRCCWWSIYRFYTQSSCWWNFFFESLQTYANLLLRLMPANYIPTRCVKPRLPVFIRVGIWIQKCVDSHLDKTRPAALKIWSCPISNEQDQNVKLKASLQHADRKKLTSSVLMGFVLNVTLCLNPWVDFTTSLPVNRCVLLSLNRKFNVVARRETSMHWDDTIYKRKATRLVKCGSANGGDCTRQAILLNNKSKNTFLTSVDLQLSNFWKR